MNSCGYDPIAWPLPDLSCLPCLPPGIQPDKFCSILQEANETVNEASGYSFTGCNSWAEIQICPTSCVCARSGCSPCSIEKVDLGEYFCAPVYEILEIKVNGEPLHDISGWRILDNCFLVCPPSGWPGQNLASAPGSRCTWSVKVRYGKAVPYGLLRLRDKYFFELLKCCYPPNLLACDKKNVKSLTTKSGTYVFDDEQNVLQEVFSRYGKNLSCFSFFSDPGNPDLLYKVLKINGGVEQDCFSCQDFLIDHVKTSVDYSCDVPPMKVKGDKKPAHHRTVYDELGQPINL